MTLLGFVVTAAAVVAPGAVSEVDVVGSVEGNGDGWTVGSDVGIKYWTAIPLEQESDSVVGDVDGVE